MSLYKLLLIIGILGLLFASNLNTFTMLGKLSDNCEEIKKKTLTQKFIVESFKNTCQKKGFESLNEWQVTCREMFNLDYIAWTEAEDFMKVSYEKSTGKLMYGRWISSLCQGEVYCRSE
ncbi:MAG: hypothetical protein K5866_06650 [Treponema sp.]|nr:hypothetical protein [Treponema sp.]